MSQGLPRTDEMVERARRALAKEMKIPIERIADDTDLETDLGLDSLDRLRMVCAVEDEFGITIDDDALPEDNRFRAVVEALLARAELAPAPPNATPSRAPAGKAAPEEPDPSLA